MTSAEHPEPDAAAEAVFTWRLAALELAPPVASVLAFFGGLALLASAAQPAVPERLRALLELWPLAAVELTHFMASVVGVLLLLVAGGLWRRLDGAYWLALALLLAGAAFSLLKALDWEEASALFAIAVLLAPTRVAFFRHSRLTAGLLTGPWLIGVVIALGLTIWLLLIAYQDVSYRDELWWTMVRDADLARSLRAVAGAVIVGLLLLAWIALHPYRPAPDAGARAADMLKAETAFGAAENARGDANLMFTGDKSFVFTPSGKTFVMFRPRGGWWIAMGDPVGAASERVDALLQFHATADAASANPVIYAASQELLPALIDLGYAVRKIGESAVVELSGFTLEGAARAKLRQAKAKLARDGWRLRVRAPHEPTDWAALRRVSDGWLARHEGREKRFSLGRFEESYLDRFPIALVEKEGAAPIAFATLWPTPDRGEIAIDLMRYGSEAPHGVMDFLLVGAIEWARDAGYRAMDLGMTPLAGLPASRYAPALSKIGAALYQAGEDIYGFKGLRAYKSKFDPTWRPVFIAAPGHVSLPLALLGAGLLTSGGVLGLVTK
jgi:lysylphosphatidylglycerol synthetase-like protein (DUF2156 family)